MAVPLDLRSQVGHGSVFTVELPLGKGPRTTARSIPGKGPIGITLDGRVIVIVEDEPAVRQGLEVLLTGWGATIVSLASVGAARAWAEGADPAAPPALVIADYRLDNGETGVAAIDLLRERFGRGVPAIVVTGSSMTGHDKEALEHDFHLLIKPVLPNKLRAMIAFKLARR
jgi:CheY-like chemotaxis protein